MVYDESTNDFINTFRKASVDVNRASSFLTTVVKKINPNVGVVGEMFAWPITPYCETSLDGMKMTYVKLMESFRFITRDGKYKYIACPDAAHRKVNILCDALSARNFHSLYYGITRQLAIIGNRNLIKPLVDSLKRTTCQNDLFHEVRMHRQDCIFMTKYGCFLQPMQAHLALKRINGDPVKKGVQSHETFLLLVYGALRRYRITQFIATRHEVLMSPTTTSEDVSPREQLLRVENDYEAYCQELLDSSDEPSRLCALFLKEMESYTRSTSGIKNGDFWINELEWCDWIGAYKLCSKSMYVNESARRMELMNNPSFSDWDLETFRTNRSYLMSKDGNDIPTDQLNEFLNLWNKSCAASPNFSTVCERSKHVILAMKCGNEEYGKKRNKHSAQPSQIHKRG